ncbi:MAG TPA: hypothetical protein VFQ61_24735, partial [Polyangiaceae bacterium]|nr:hypothetical protein [Polyangiaceae bacterium]
MHGNATVAFRPASEAAAFWRPLAVAGLLAAVLGVAAWLQNESVKRPSRPAEPASMSSMNLATPSAA